MDHQQLLDSIKDSIRESHAEMRQDIKGLDAKLDNYQERLIKVESTLGFIKLSLAGAMAAVGSVVTYISYKIIDFLVIK